MAKNEDQSGDVARTFAYDLPLYGGRSLQRLPLTEYGATPSTQERLTIDIGGKAFTVARGLTAMLGRTKSGKSSLRRALIEADSARRLVYVNLLEPFDTEAEASYAGREFSVCYTLEEALGVVADLCQKGLVPIVDSMRVLTYEGGGATGKRGINMGMFGYLTALNNKLAQYNLSMIALVNPLIDDPEDFKAFKENVESSVVSVIEVDSPTSFLVQSRPNRDRVVRFRFSAQQQAAATRANAKIPLASDFPDSTSVAAVRGRSLDPTPLSSALSGDSDFN